MDISLTLVVGFAKTVVVGPTAVLFFLAKTKIAWKDEKGTI